MMIPSLIVSGILFVTIIFFTYSIFVILRQKQLSEMQKDFINNMTHEFKTPISTIKISADVFNNDPLIANNERLKRYASIVAEQNQRLNHQVEKVLQIAKIERDEFKLNKEPLHLHQIIEECLMVIKLKIETSHGELNTQLEAKNDLILADRLHLTNVIHNLLDNAIKYCKSTPVVTIITENTNDKLKLMVRDEGIGIAKEYQEKIFQKFYRVPTGNVHNVKGFGLGLFYVKSICQAHRWKITFDSILHQETTVTISMNYA
ncbi:MAG: HAMP domain-containing histidine kinase [Saprospiraceae bacterium]|nr:HAMP domain-containing histidine kinase [Saprospiraceae bacterium]